MRGFLVGVGALLLASVRAWDRLLLWLGSFSVLYAVRLFVENDLVHAAMNVQAQELAGWTSCLTYLIPIPYALFARELFGPGWKASITIWLWIEIAFALVAIPLALFAHQTLWTDSLNGVLVIGGTALILLHVFLSHGQPNSLVNP